MEKMQEDIAKIMTNRVYSDMDKIISLRYVKQEDPNIIEGKIKFLDGDKE